MSYLLDTNVISELRRPSGDANVRAWFASVRGDDLHLSVLVTGEIRQGIERLRPRDPVRAQALERWLERLNRDFHDRVVGVDAAVADRWGRLNAGRPLPVVDGLLGATALVHDFTLVTRNVGDLEGTGVALLDPFGWPYGGTGAKR